MEHALVDVAPGRQRSMPAAAAVQPDQGRAGLRSRRLRWQMSARPVRHRHQAVLQRAEMREFESALARWAR
jgi:hypothetical protein